MMTMFAASAALVLLLMILVIYLAVRADGPLSPVNDEDVLAPPEVFVRLFASQDWQYVAQNCGPRIRARFERERSRLAIEWLREARLAMKLLWVAHRKAAGASTGLVPATEMKLAAQFSLFWILTMTLSMLVASNQVLAVRRLWRLASAPAHMIGAMNESLRTQLIPQAVQ